MCILNEIGGFKSKFLFCLHVQFFLFLFWVFVFFFNFPVVDIKSFVSLLTLFFPLIIQDWNKNVNVIYFRQHLFSCVVIKYIFKVNISPFFQSFCIHLDPGNWFSLIVRFRFLFFLIDSRYQSNSAFVFWYLRLVIIQFFSEQLERLS